MRGWFVDTKLSIHYGEEKLNALFSVRKKNLQKLNITYDNDKKKQFPYNRIPWLLSER